MIRDESVKSQELTPNTPTGITPAKGEERKKGAETKMRPVRTIWKRYYVVGSQTAIPLSGACTHRQRRVSLLIPLARSFRKLIWSIVSK